MNTIKNIFILLLLTTTGLVAQDKEADKVLGIWQNETKDGRIEIYKSGTSYTGKLIWGNRMFEADGKTSKKDVNNPNPKLRARPLQNLVMLNNFTYANGVWEDGTIYDPDSGKTYDCLIRLKNEKLEIRGYVGLSLFGRTVVWERVN